MSFEIIQSQKDKTYMMPLKWGMENNHTLEAECRMVFTKFWRKGLGGSYPLGKKFQLYGMIKV